MINTPPSMPSTRNSLSWWPFLLPGLLISVLAFFDVWKSTDQSESYLQQILTVGLAVLVAGAVLRLIFGLLQSKTPRQQRWFLFALAANTAMLALMLLVAEMILLLLGFPVFAEPNIVLRDDTGKRFWQTDPYLGFRLAEGPFRFSVTSDYAWTATHSPQGQRLTSNPTVSSDHPELWVLGCSFTYGWSINDNQTLAARLQEQWPDWNIRCWAVPGFGTTQSFLQLKRALEAGDKPDIVYYGYGSFHETRNVLSRDRQRAFARTDPQAIHLPPFAQFNPKGDIEVIFQPPHFYELPGMRWSRLLTLIEGSYDNLQMQWLPSQQVTWKLLEEMNRLCQQKKISFLIGALTQDELTSQLIAHAQKSNLDLVDLAPPAEFEGCQNLPFDGHPSAKFQRLCAEKIAAHLTKRVPEHFQPWQIHLALARSLRQAGQHEQALWEIARARANSANAPPPILHYEAGLTAIALDYEAQARFDLESCVATAPNFKEAINALARVEALADNFSVRQPEESRATSQRLLDQNGQTNPWFLETRALAEASAGQWNEAINLAQKALNASQSMSAPVTSARLQRTLDQLHRRELPSLSLADLEGPIAP
jgi:tetratricopeptide (TPR) repeat protein